MKSSKSQNKLHARRPNSGVNKKLEKLQRSVAGYLNKKINGLEPSTRKIALIVVGIIIGLTCVAIIFESVF